MCCQGAGRRCGIRESQHGSCIDDTTYEALTGGELPLPAGSIVVKENYMPASGERDHAGEGPMLGAVTVMYKSEGYNPDFNDWFWIKRMADGTVAASGKVESCQGCHAQATDHDYLVTAMQEE